MRENAFKAWTLKRVQPQTTDRRVRACLRVERSEKIDIDDEYKKDKMKHLLDRYTYSQADEDAGISNPTKTNIINGSVLNALRWYKSHLNQYKRFCESNPPK